MMIVANCSRATSSTLGSTCEFTSTENLSQEESTQTQIVMESLNIKHMIADSIFEGIGYLNYEKKFWDLTIHVKGQIFCCHRVLLASISKFFKNNLVPDNKKIFPMNVYVNNNNVTPQLFGSLLDILYTGKDPVTVESVKDYLKMSAYLQIDFLTKYCESFLVNNFTANNVLSFWKFAQAHTLPNVAKICYTWAAEHIDTLPQDELLSLPKSMLLIILSLQKKLSMDAVCQRILSWVDIDLDKRQIYLAELLPFVCFPHLSPSYLFDLSCNLRYQPNDVLCGGISQGVEFYLKGICGNDANLQMQILTQQTVKLQLPDIESCCVAIGVKTETNSSPQGVFTISNKTCCPLAPAPKNPGLHFASCTWQNAIYLSGGSRRSNFFAVYRPGDNQWQELPNLPNGREKHAMAAVNSCIYVIGGSLNKRRFPNNRQSSWVLKYDLKSSTWHDFCWLPDDVLEATAAVLGHRIYLFGGMNSDLVQCVDTRGRSVYIAGRLPCTRTLRALSNGGIIYIVLSPQEILLMWENFDMAEKTEESLAVQNDGNLPQESRVCETVSFVQIKTQAVFGYVSEKCYFSACLLDGVITMVSGRTAQGQLRSTIESIDIETGDPCCEPIDFEGLVACGLHVLNVPQVHLMEVPGENQESSESPDNTSTLPPVLLNSATAHDGSVIQPQEM